MKKNVLIAGLAVIMLGRPGVEAAELPSFELMGFPITSVQVQVVGAAQVEECSPIPTLTLGGMPASPHQISVLTSRSTIAADALAARLGESGSSEP